MDRRLSPDLLDAILRSDVGHNVASVPDLANCQVVHVLPDQAPEDLGVLQLDGHTSILALLPVVEFVVVLAGACTGMCDCQTSWTSPSRQNGA